MSKLLWEPSVERVKETNIYSFIAAVNKTFNMNIQDYPALYQWSIDNIEDFWAMIWEFTEVIASSTYDKVVDDLSKMPGAQWFPGAKLNFAENLLRYRDERTALIFKGEDRVHRKITYKELYDEVASVATSLKEMGIKPGDRIAAFMPNMPETIIAMLAAVSLGAVWSSCSPDFGIKGVLDRFGQIKPRVLFTANGYSFKGKEIDSLESVKGITEALPSIEKVVVVPYTQADPDISSIPPAVNYHEFRSQIENPEITFEQLPFSQDRKSVV